MNNLIGQHFLISGRVQGVFYRRFAKHAAIALELSGWARNLPDGNVEIAAFGTEEKLTAYALQLRLGPPMAKVKDVSIQPITWEPYSDFQIKE